MSFTFPPKVTVYEVAPRDGLQNEQSVVTAPDKIEFINRLGAAGLPFIEATSFVRPQAVPQLGDAAEVFSGLAKHHGTRYPVLVPNVRGMERALEAGVKDIAVFTAASESFTKANINASIDESFSHFAPVVQIARESGVPVRGYVSTALGCPYEGAVAPQKVREVALRLLDLGVWQVSVGDTIGVGSPKGVTELFDLLLRDIPSQALAAHFHDTRGTALANVLIALQMGITTIDSSAAGLGGCPYAPGAAGNLATEDLVYMLHDMDVETGVDLDRLADASLFILSVLRKAPPSKYLQAYAAEQRPESQPTEVL